MKTTINILDNAGVKTLCNNIKTHVSNSFGKNIFVGTENEYSSVSENLGVGALIVITDDSTFYVKTSNGRQKIASNGTITTKDIVDALGYTPAANNILDSYKDVLNRIEYANNTIIFKDALGNTLVSIDKDGITGNLNGTATHANEAAVATNANTAKNAESADQTKNSLVINYGSSDSSDKLNSISFNGSTQQTITITPEALGLTGAMLYIGTSSTTITDGGTEKPTINGSVVNPSNGNVVIYSNKEFIWNGSAWEIFGDEKNHKVIQTPVSDPTANGTSKTFISNISQDANGNITVYKKTFDESTISAQTITSNLVKTDKVQYTNKLEIVNNSGNVDTTISGGTITATKFKGTLEGTASDALTATNATKFDGKEISYFSPATHTHAVSGTAKSNGAHTHTVNATSNTTNVSAPTHTHTALANSSKVASVAAQAHTHIAASDGAHSHTVTAAGSVSLSGTYSSGTLTISASFAGSSVNTSNHTGHTHTVGATGSNSVSVSTSDHTHTTNADSSNVISVATAAHTHTTESTGAHTHTVNGSAVVHS